MFVIDTKSNTPIYEQLILQTKELLLMGILRPGDQLPSVRQLASLLTINPNTVNRAYQELERQKIIETIRGKGTFICAKVTRREDEEKKEQLFLKLKGICYELYYLGINEEEIKKELHQIFKVIEGEKEK